MLILLSPSKALDFERPAPAALALSEPRLQPQTQALLALMRNAPPSELQRLMGISDALAQLNHARYQAFEQARAHPALFAFDGDVYTGLEAATLSPEDVAWAQRHVRILSGLYGVLRPLDLIRPYRLEMGVRLANSAGPDLYAFWREAVSRQLAADLREAGGGAVVNLASDEYFGAVDPALLGAEVLTPVFQEVREGKARALFMYLKQARGAMTRFAIQTRARTPEQLQAFSLGGYRFAPEASAARRWVFQRPQPALKGKRRAAG